MRKRILFIVLLLLSIVPIVGCAAQEAMLTIPASCTIPQFTFQEDAKQWVETTIQFSCPKS